MRLDLDVDQRVAGRAAIEAGLALALQAQGLTVLAAGGNFDLQRRAVGERNGARRAVQRVEELDLHVEMPVVALHLHAAAATPGAAREEAGEQIVALTEIGKAAAIVIGAALGAGAGIIAIEIARRLLGAGGVDLAAIEAAALVLVADDAIGGGNILELALGILVSGIKVRMQFLGQLAIGALDLFLGRIPLDAQQLVWVSAHMVSVCGRDTRGRASDRKRISAAGVFRLLVFRLYVGSRLPMSSSGHGVCGRKSTTKARLGRFLGARMHFSKRGGRRRQMETCRWPRSISTVLSSPRMAASIVAR